MSELIKVSKEGEPELEVLADHLAQYVKLGWAKVEAQEEAPAKRGRAKKEAE